MVDYEKLWADKDFKQTKGRTLLHCDLFLSLYNHIESHTNAPSIGIEPTLIDWGCGNGSHVQRFMEHGVEVVGMVDIAPNSIDQMGSRDYINDEIMSIFQAAHIKDATPEKAHWSYCSDVLEHVPESEIDDSIRNIVQHTKKPGFIFFNISTRSDKWDEKELHVTQKGFQWWIDKMESLIPGVTIFSCNYFWDSLGTLWYIEE